MVNNSRLLAQKRKEVFTEDLVEYTPFSRKFPNFNKSEGCCLVNPQLLRLIELCSNKIILMNQGPISWHFDRLADI